MADPLPTKWVISITLSVHTVEDVFIAQPLGLQKIPIFETGDNSYISDEDAAGLTHLPFKTVGIAKVIVHPDWSGNTKQSS